MAYVCPRCGAPVSRSSAGKGTQVAFGAVGMLVSGAFGNFRCPACGEIPRSEFPPEVRSSMTAGSVGMVAGAVVLVVAVILLITWLLRL